MTQSHSIEQKRRSETLSLMQKENSSYIAAILNKEDHTISIDSNCTSASEYLTLFTSIPKGISTISKLHILQELLKDFFSSKEDIDKLSPNEQEDIEQMIQKLDQMHSTVQVKK